MRAMKENEIDRLTDVSKWANIITTSPDGYPYAIEATPFKINGDIGFMISPKGGTSKNLVHSNKVLLKYTLASNDLEFWAGASLFGEGSYVRDPELIGKGWKLLGEIMGADYSTVAQKFIKNPENSPLFVVKVNNKTSRCSAKAGEEFKIDDKT
ncbi:MAG: hypothetical protein LBF41_00110 [Deltaproteobacteria bacterium]|jgi:hypothetical protein|nr:hypothetical protein [Deltaproteobacteria bacterium]